MRTAEEMDEEAWPGWRTDRQLKMCKLGPHLLRPPVTTCISQDVFSATAPGGTSRLTPGKHTRVNATGGPGGGARSGSWNSGMLSSKLAGPRARTCSC